VNDYRERFLNDTFIRSLGLPTPIETNLINRQFRPDLSSGGGERYAKPQLNLEERTIYFGQEFSPVGNVEQSELRTRGPFSDFPARPPLSLAYGGESLLHDYSGLVQFWALGTNTGFQYETSFPSQWTSNILAGVNNGVSHWESYQYSGNTEVYQYFDYASRIWFGVPCGGTNPPCNKGDNLRNVMMADVPGNTSASGVFPFSIPAGFSGGATGPAGAQLAGMFIGAVFYDIANEAGLGVYKAHQIAWKMISLITNNRIFTLKDFGATVQAATHTMWPDDRYGQDVADVLASRGVPVNGATDFHDNLPVAIGPAVSIVFGTNEPFASGHPNQQPNVDQYGQYAAHTAYYTMTNAGTAYVAFQFYKHSKYGPCDELQFTDGTFNPTTGVYNNDGTYYVALTDREPGNLILIVPGTTIRSRTLRMRCADEATGFYAEDVRPFGYIVTQGTPNGFSFTVSALSSNATFKTYQLVIVDPSTNTLGAATYNWSFVFPT
jgi:hypothetical protein